MTNSPQTDVQTKAPALSGNAMTASITSGAGLILTFLIENTSLVAALVDGTSMEADKLQSGLLPLVPGSAVLFAIGVQYIWKAWGRNPAEIKANAKLKRAKKLAQAGLKDPNLSEAGKAKLQAHYDNLVMMESNIYLALTDSPQQEDEPISNTPPTA